MTGHPPTAPLGRESGFAQSADIDQLAEALCAVFADLSNIDPTRTARVPTKDGGAYSYKFVNIADVLAAVRPVLASNGLATLQSSTIVMGGAGKEVEIATRLLHTSGQWIENTAAVGVSTAADAQAVGSAMTYARRYGLLALLGIAAGEEDDDDGGRAAASSPGRRPPATGDYDADYQAGGEPGAMPAATLDRANAKGMFLEAILAAGGTEADAGPFWLSLHTRDEAGPFDAHKIEREAKTAARWLASRTAAPLPPTPADQPAPAPTPPNPFPGAENAPQRELSTDELAGIQARVDALAAVDVRKALRELGLPSDGTEDEVRDRLVDARVERAAATLGAVDASAEATTDEWARRAEQEAGA